MIRKLSYNNLCLSPHLSHICRCCIFFCNIPHLGHVKRKRAFKHGQNVQICIILPMPKVSSEPLLYNGTFYSIKWFWQQTAKALIRLCRCAVWSGPLLSAHAPKAHFLLGVAHLIFLSYSVYHKERSLMWKKPIFPLSEEERDNHLFRIPDDPKRFRILPELTQSLNERSLTQPQMSALTANPTLTQPRQSQLTIPSSFNDPTLTMTTTQGTGLSQSVNYQKSIEAANW